MSVVNFCEASSDVLVSLHEMLSSSQLLNSDSCDTEQYCFSIEYVLKSESAWVLFVQPSFSEEKLVIKLLCDYQDTRYNMGSINERQKCQCEALEWNKRFSPHVYYGLARVCDLDVQQKKIVLGQFISRPVQEELYLGSDYGLVMHRLSKESQLDILLSKEGADFLQCYMQPLVNHIAQIHRNCEALPPEESAQWGSYEQLQKKLSHNLALADSVLEDNRGNYPEEFREAFLSLKDRMCKNFPWHVYKGYFEQRTHNRCIKRCHGDLKASNIWIDIQNNEGELLSILDAIDFNPMYCNIDTLSDFAMLIVDVQARTNSAMQAESLLELYLKETHQEDDISRAVLNYYLFEKAYVSAAISIVYSVAPEFGHAYLSVAKGRLDFLLEHLMLPA